MKPARIDLDFHRAPAQPWRWVGWCLLLLSAGGLAWIADEHAAVLERHAQLLDRQSQLERRLRAREPQRVAPAADARAVVDLQRANAVIEQLTVPWDRLFAALEAADTKGVGLLAVTPTARDRQLRVSGEARTLDEVLAYIERLGAQPAVSEVHLVGHNRVQRDGAAVVSFSVAARWSTQP